MINFKKDKNAEPVDENLSLVLGNSFSVYKTLVEKLSDYEASLEWRFYKDGGWLAKVTHKKKTIIWGSPEDGYFSASFLFSEKPHLREGILQLDISDELKNKLISTPGGNYFSLAIDVYSENDLPNVYKLIEFKKHTK